MRSSCVPPLHARQCDLERQSKREIKVARGGLSPLAPTRTLSKARLLVTMIAGPDGGPGADSLFTQGALGDAPPKPCPNTAPCRWHRPQLRGEGCPARESGRLARSRVGPRGAFPTRTGSPRGRIVTDEPVKHSCFEPARRQRGRISEPRGWVGRGPRVPLSRGNGRPVRWSLDLPDVRCLTRRPGSGGPGGPQGEGPQQVVGEGELHDDGPDVRPTPHPERAQPPVAGERVDALGARRAFPGDRLRLGGAHPDPPLGDRRQVPGVAGGDPGYGTAGRSTRRRGAGAPNGRGHRP